MRFVAAAIIFLVPLAFAPAWFFYFDVTPKACLLFVGAALLAALSWHEGLPNVRASRAGRWYTGLAIGLAMVAALAAFSSPDSRLAWLGSNWRRGGAVTEIATLLAAVLIATTPRMPALRALCAAGFLASLYGIAQYFGWDPWLAPSAYEAGEGVYQIVRPPSTLGHSDYFAAFLLWPIFTGVGLWWTGRWKWAGAIAALTGILAVLLSGSRGALLGLICGAALLLFLGRIPVRAALGAVVAAALVLGVFAASPLGARLRARAFWISEDRTGGARFLLWKDSLRMAAARPLLGFGPDAFVAEFPQFQSRELARAYPDFYHESPHNIFLDVLTAEGVVGLALFAAMIAVGLAAGWRTRADDLSAALLAAFAASLVAQQFIVFVLPTALLFYLGIGWLVALPGRSIASPRNRAWACAAGIVSAVALFWAAHLAGSGDRALLRAKLALQSGDADASSKAMRDEEAHRATGVTAGIELSRLAIAAASQTKDVPSKLVFEQLAASAAVAATQIPEQRANAFYNLAVLQAASNSASAVEASLRAATLAAPQWYKPHWMLARVLASRGNSGEASQQAAVALDLDNARHPEVSRTLETILRSVPSHR